MLNAASAVPFDCTFVMGARIAGVALLGLAIVALEAWLRVPVRPLFDGYVQEAQARVVGLVASATRYLAGPANVAASE